LEAHSHRWQWRVCYRFIASPLEYRGISLAPCAWRLWLSCWPARQRNVLWNN